VVKRVFRNVKDIGVTNLYIAPFTNEPRRAFFWNRSAAWANGYRDCRIADMYSSSSSWSHGFYRTSYHAFPGSLLGSVS
jgi:hypothetical protein